ncbi:MAG: tetratricopeptide repeat protein [Bacteroidales bacterium]|nr:tetratricopeptide repeat protein [Bacteroidales bacterium]
MKRLTGILTLLLSVSVAVFAQAPADKREVRSGNRDFKRDNYKEAEIDYRKALIKDSTSVAANYNLANTLYRMQDWEQAGKFIETAEAAENADVYYNKGDIALQNKDYNTAVDAFKQALLLNPGDLDAKENYIYAKKMLEDQQQNGGGGGGNNDQNQNQNQDQNQNQNNDQNKDNQDNQDQNQDQNQDNGQGQGGQQPELSPQAAEQMLQAIAAKEKDTQDKVKKAEAFKAQSRQKEKNW